MPAPPLHRRVIYAAIAAVGALWIAECGARQAGRPPDGPALVLHGSGESYPAFTRFDETLGWRQIAGAVDQDPVFGDWMALWGLPDQGRGEVRTNARGFRDDPIIPAQPGHARVLVLGDSSVWGSGVPQTERFTERLEVLLAPRDVAVLNSGVPGYSTWQSLAILRESADLEVDGVIVYNLISDMGGVRGAPDDLWFASPTRQRGTLMMRASALYGWLRFAVFQVRERQHVSRDPTPHTRVHVSQYRQNLRTIAAEAARQGAWVVGVVPPIRTDVAPSGVEDARPYSASDAAGRTKLSAELDALDSQPSASGKVQDFRRAMTLEMYAAGAPVVDGPVAFAAALAQQPENFVRERSLFVDEVHPSSAGHQVLAAAMLPVVAAQLDAKPD
jgi:lysophospholipase L1-like esterase